MTTMKDKLNEIEARCEAATDGPWMTTHQGEFGEIRVCQKKKGADTLGFAEIESNIEDATFIAHSRQDIPKLLKVVRILSEALEKYDTREVIQALYDNTTFNGFTAMEAIKQATRALEGKDGDA